MKKLYSLIALSLTFSFSFAQNGTPINGGVNTNETPIFSGNQTKAVGDSCGTYFNNYVGLGKTSNVFVEPMRRGNGSETGFYNGRAQRFTISQDVEVSGVEFYAYKQNTALDSIMVITSLHSYDVPTDSVGAEITRDTVYVSHTAFDIVLPNISVQSYFDAPVTMTTDYIVAIHTPTDDSLWICTNNYSIPDGAGENLSHALYDNPTLPSWTGWYSNLTDFSYDYDYLINPLVKFDLHDGFTVLNDSICPGAIGAGCVDYIQVGNFSNPHYTGASASPNDNIVWLWGDGFQNTDITSACHTYSNPGSYTISLIDTLNRWDFFNPTCIVNLTETIFVEDTVFADFTSTSTGLTADFVNTSTNADSVWWDFGDATAGENTLSPSHTYTSVATYDVWLYAYNDCFVDSIMYQVSIGDAGVDIESNGISIYPNPAKDNFAITGIEEGSTIELMNLLGEVIFISTANNNKEIINIENLPVGTYFVKITTDKKQVTKKVIKH